MIFALRRGGAFGLLIGAVGGLLGYRGVTVRVDSVPNSEIARHAIKAMPL